ncbi:MAG: hypothetical protein AB9879_05205 [Methanothrix sp.]|jgi:hypothetical protein
MKALLTIVLVAVALMGAASAWDDSAVLTYSFKKTVNEQDAFTNLAGTVSGAQFRETDSTIDGTPYSSYNQKGSTVGGLELKLESVTPTFADPYATGDTHQSLTQTGQVTVSKASLSSEDDVPEISVDIQKAQNYIFSGQFTGMSASFDERAGAGTNVDPALESILTSCGNLHAIEGTGSIKPSGSITTTGGAKVSEGAIGYNSWTSLDADAWKNSVTMEGGLDVHSQFFGDTIVPNSGSITTSVAGQTTHSWDNSNGYTPYWTTGGNP